MPTLKLSHIFIPALMLLSACGGGDGGCAPSDGRPLDSTTDTSANCADTRAANTINIVYGGDGSITQLTGDSAGLYSRFGSTIVTDQNANAVPDNTLVQLDAFDTLIARGTIAAGDTISGSTLTDNAGILQGDGLTATTFTTSVVVRGSSNQVIEAGDLVILRNAATSDQIRYVVSTTGNTITVDAPYNNTYPNALYPDAKYLVGRALVGAKVHGFDENGVKTLGLGRTDNGIANFRLEYPNEILNYGASATDARFDPPGSAEVWVIANVGGRVATAAQAVFVGIAPVAISLSQPSIGASGTVTVTLEDANGNSLPFIPVTASSTNAATLGTSCTTDEDGECPSVIVYGGADTITYSASGASTDLTVN